MQTNNTVNMTGYFLCNKHASQDSRTHIVGPDRVESQGIANAVLHMNSWLFTIIVELWKIPLIWKTFHYIEATLSQLIQGYYNYVNSFKNPGKNKSPWLN